MAGTAFDDWLARGRTHQFEGRPADAIPCFRRAAREDPASPVPLFHLGEVLWQLGLAADALAAWQASAQRHRTFLPPRLALAEAAMTRLAFDDAHRLAADHPEDYDRYSPMVSRLLHLMVIDILTTAVALRLPGELRPMLQEIKKNLRAKRFLQPPG